MYLAAGYAIRKLKRKYQRLSNNKAAQLYLEVITTWVTVAGETTEDEDDFNLTAEVTSWTTMQDRGGLLQCSPEYFHFMKVVEKNVRVFINVDTIHQYANENIIVKVTDLVMSKPEVQQSFQRLISHRIQSDDLCMY